MVDRSSTLRVDEIAERTGMHPSTIRRRLQRGDLRVFIDPMDLRRRLLLAEDLEKLTALRPVERDREREIA